MPLSFSRIHTHIRFHSLTPRAADRLAHANDTNKNICSEVGGATRETKKNCLTVYIIVIFSLTFLRIHSLTHTHRHKQKRTHANENSWYHHFDSAHFSQFGCCFCFCFFNLSNSIISAMSHQCLKLLSPLELHTYRCFFRNENTGKCKKKRYHALDAPEWDERRDNEIKKKMKIKPVGKWWHAACVLEWVRGKEKESTIEWDME